MSSAIGKSAAAAMTTTAAQLLSSAPSAAEKNKQWQRELLMERIRSRSNQHKTFAELSKAMRMSMLEKRYALDAVEKANLQKCLDSMQHCIKVTSRQGLVERLESLSRQLGLKFMEDTSGLFISTDMFFLEIILDPNGALTDVKVHHECKIEQQSCSELVNCLNRGDFADFTVQLEGLSSIYQLNAEPKVKTKAFVALQAMETDLYNIFQMQNFTKDSHQLVKASSVGLALKRRGGHPMKLIYFVSPYDLISLDSKSVQPLTTELITCKDIGLSVTVNLEASSANKLQILPIVSVTNDPQTGLDVPIYAALNQQNSMLLPATFVLRLNKPLPVCHASLRALGVPLGVASDSASGIESPNKKEVVISSIMNLVVQTASEQQFKNSQKGLFVNLPDQTHCYFFTENKQLQATLVSSIPFTEPMQVPKILDFLKRQALFYSLLASCVRTQSKMGNDMESTTILEANAISFQQISVSLQHPYEESMATVEFDLRDGNVKCTIFSLTQNYDLLSLKLTKIVEKCLSIPVTIRALLKFWDQETMKMFQRSINGSVGGGVGGLGGTGACGGTTTAGYGHFGMVGGPNDSGGAGGVRGGNAVKIEPNTRQQQMPSMASASTTLAGGGGAAGSSAGDVAGFLQYKTEIKQEDFHNSPKSQMQNSFALHAAESSSLGGLHHLQQTQQQQQQQQQQQHQHQQHQQQPMSHDQLALGKQSEIEIADKYKNIWMDKTTNLKNCVSITPISPDSNSRGAHQLQGVDVKRSVGIEIIPLTAQCGGAANGGNGGGGAATISSGPTVSQSGVNTSSTITITPINAVGGNSNTGKDKKSSSSGTVVGNSGLPTSAGMSASVNKRQLDGPTPTDTQKEKKRKKKRDDSPMGPPEKVYSRQNSPAATIEAAATVVARKFSSPSSSPKGGSSGGMLSSGSAAATLAAAGNAALLSTRPSPKHSPVYSSPKHTNTASNSPKSPFGTHSPKHGSSGKPSMSTLKSATATSLSPKGDKSGSGSSSGSCSSSLVSSALGLSAAAAAGVAAANAVKSAMGVGVGVVGMQQMKTINHLAAPAAMNAAGGGGYGGVSNMAHMGGGSGGGGVGQLMSGNGAGSGMDMNVAASQAAAMRKVVGGAVSSTASTMSVAPTTATTTQAVPVAPQPVLQRSPPVIGSSESNICEEHAADSTHQQSSCSTEYMVKTSQEGLKLTINKTSGGGKSSGNSGGGGVGAGSCPSTSATTATAKTAKTNSATSATTNTTIKKQHTGLKPGVNSGPASKKLLAAKSPSKKSATAKHPFQKSNSSGSLTTKSSSGTGSGLTKSYSANSFGDLVGSSGGSSRKSAKKSASSSSSTTTATPTPPTRMDHQADMLKILQYASPAMAANMEGFMKGLNSKFQIPKLSQRATNTNTAINGAQLAPMTPTNAAASSSSSTTGSKDNDQANEALQQRQAPNQLTKLATNVRSSPLLYAAASGDILSPTIGFQPTATTVQLNANYHHSQQQSEGIQMQRPTQQYANQHRQQQPQSQYSPLVQQQQHAAALTGDYHQASAVTHGQIRDETTFRASAAPAAASSTGLAGK